jgi:hypothetical protein
MISLRVFLAGLMLLGAGSAYALDLGGASGRYDRDKVRIEVSHAIALRQDNTEGLLDNGPQVRVLLSDRDVPIQALYGVAFPPVRAMARKGELRGLLLEFDPADRNTLRITILAKPDDPTEFAPSLSLSDSNGLWRRLTVDASHVEGDFQSSDGPDFAFSFSAPIQTDPVVADLKGPAALSSEQVRVLTARAQAIGRGDLQAALSLSTRQAGADLQTIPPAELKQASAAMAQMIKSLKSVRRVVVRKSSAVVIMPGGDFSTLAFEDGAWKVAD